jgi:capsular polysaccharide biosynthesis protein
VELRTYGKILWRRLWIIVLIVGVVALYAGYQYFSLLKTPGALKAYQSQVVIRIGLQATPTSSDQYYTDYQAISEALADELVTGPVLTSREFIAQVQVQLSGDGVTLGDDAAIASALNSTRTHALVTISAIWSDPSKAQALANAVGKVSVAHMSSYLDYEVRKAAGANQPVHPIVTAQIVNAATEPTLTAGPAANKPVMLLVLVLLALVIGIALAFLVEYLDDRIRNRDQAKQILQLPVYGEIPRSPAR